MKVLRFLSLVTFVSLATFGCKDKVEDINTDPVDDRGRIIINSDIAQDRTLTNDKKYILRNYVYVKSGVTLTIQAGTTVFGDKDSKGTLVVQQGGKLVAEGTATAPIVFTSSQVKGSRNYGDWGGVVLMGKAPVNRPAANRVPEGGINGTYGGTDANDNSGVLKYVRIEFAGIALSTTTNSEINGLTLYGVGSGTTIEYVQVSYSGDDSFEWFGGSVNGKYLIAHRGWDDDFDTDFGFSGKVQYAVSLRDPLKADASTSNSFESDNFDPGTPATGSENGLPLTACIFANVSVFLTDQATLPTSTGSGPYGRAMHLRRNTAISIYNSVFVGHPEGLRLDGGAGSTYDNYNGGTMKLSGLYFVNNPTAISTAGGAVLVDVQNIFNNVNNKNSITTNANFANAKLNTSSFNLTAPNFQPQAGSPLLTAANAASVPSGLTQSNYIGAFDGTNNWMAGWSNFDPQNTDY